MRLRFRDSGKGAFAARLISLYKLGFLNHKWGNYMINMKILLLAAAASGLAMPTLAQEMRCGNRLISGDQIHPLIKEQVLEICGEPTSKQFDRWFYEAQGKILVFNDNGELDHIEDAASTD